MTPAKYYYRLRRHYDPTFEPDPKLELGWWEKFEALCKKKKWEPFEAIERVFHYIAGLHPDDIKDTSFSKGYPNLAELCSEHLLQAAFNSTHFTPQRVREIQVQMNKVNRETSHRGRTVEDVCLDKRFAVDRLTAVFLCPSLRNQETIQCWDKEIAELIHDPRVWDNYTQAGFDAHIAEEIKQLWLKHKEPKKLKKSYDPRITMRLERVALRVLKANTKKGPRIDREDYFQMVEQIKHLVDLKNGGLTPAGAAFFANNKNILQAAEDHMDFLRKQNKNR